MPTSRFALRLLATLLPLSAPSLLAQDAPPAEAPAPNKPAISQGDFLESLVVTATRTAEDPKGLPQSVVVVGEKRIKEKLPGQAVDVLREEPGVWIQQTGAGGGAPIVRGQIGNQVLYLIDGIRINNGASFAGPNAFFNQVDVGMLEQVEVLKGPGSVQFGSDALGGVINLRTKSLDIFPDQPEYGGMISGQFSSANNGVRVHGEIWYADDNFNAMVAGSSWWSDDYRIGGGRKLDYTSLESHSGMLKSQLKIDEGHVLTFGYLETWRLNVNRYDQSKRNASGVPRFFTPEEDRRLFYLKDSIELQGGVVSKIEPYVYFQDYQARSLFSAESGTQLRTDETLTDQEMFGLGVQTQSEPNDCLKFVYGIDYRYEDLGSLVNRATLTKASRSVAYSIPIGNTPDGSYDSFAAFAMADWRPSEKWRVNLGGRFESTHLDSDPSATDPTAGFTVADLDLDERWNAATFSGGLLYWVTDHLGLSADVASGFRAPTYSDVLSFGAFTFGVNVPSTNVDPEHSINFEIGPRWESEHVSARATYFHTWLDDLMTSERVPGFTDLNGNGTEDAGEANYATANGGEGYIQGVELQAEWLICDQWSVYGNMAWTEGRNETSRDNLRFIPPLNGVAGVRYQPWDRLVIEAYARMVATHDKVSASDRSDPGRASDPANTFPSAGNPPLRADYSIPGYTTFNLRASYMIDEATKAYLAANNLTDKKYREAYSRLDAPGFNLTMGLERTF